MYSQNNEEKFIVEYFANKLNGTFLDIGGYNPFKFSNTRRLYELGWSGIYIEPSPICFGNFLKEYENEPRIKLINKAVCTNPKVTQIKFYEAGGDAVSTSDINHKNKWEKSGSKFNEILVDTIHVKELESQFKNIDFLSIDVESTNYELFSSFSDVFFSKISMICIEHDNTFEQIIARLSPLGFKLVTKNPENVILSK